MDVAPQITALAEVGALAMMGFASSALTVRAACDALVADFDTPELRDLAALSEQSDQNEIAFAFRFSLFAFRFSLFAFRRTIASFGLATAEADDAAYLDFAIACMCRKFLLGELPPRRLTLWAHSRVGHGGPDSARELVDLDDRLEGHENYSYDEEYGVVSAAARAYLAR